MSPSVEALAQVFAARERSYRQSLLAASALLAVSEFAKRMYVAHGYPADRISVVPISTPTLDRIQWRQRRFTGYPIRFGFVGRVSPFKGAHVLAAAMRGVAPDLAEFHFFGSVRPEDRRYLLNLSGCHPGAVFHGGYDQRDLPQILDRIDVLILPSIMQETICLVGLEAQAAGLPIIGADVGAIPEYVHHGFNGLLFEAANPASLRAQIETVLAEPALVDQYSSRVSPPRKMDAHVDELLTLYRAVRERASTARDPLSVGSCSREGRGDAL
ncbi:MAG: glycosyltransferase [Armatimonadota bacterium]|nr:glycosyltransferase [Armatimonadota bacterium]